VAQRNEFYPRISATIVNVQNSSEQCRQTLPLLQSTVLETQSTDSSVREHIAQQASTIIVLKKMEDTLQPVRTGILQRCEQAVQFVSLQTNLVSDVGTVVLEVNFILTTTVPNAIFCHGLCTLHSGCCESASLLFGRPGRCSKLNCRRTGRFLLISYTNQHH
jgi:hypothetical protein